MTAPIDSPKRGSALVGLGWLLFVSLGFVALLASALAWRFVHSPDYEENQAVISQLQDIVAREQLYFRSNQTYTADLSNLGIPLSDLNGWTFRALVVRQDGEPVVLAEATRGDRRIALTSGGQLFRSYETSLPRVASFKLESPGSGRTPGNQSAPVQLKPAGAAGQEPTSRGELR